MTDFQALRIEMDEHVATITLTRPELLNRFDEVLHHEFTDALRALDADPAVRAVLLSSTGRAFSAGGDFAMMRTAHDSAEARRAIIGQARAVVAALTQLRQPIVAAMQGPAVGLGATVVLGCDAVVALASATLSDAHVAMGLVAGDGGALFWPHAAGMLRARRYLLTGDAIDGRLAYQFGLVTDVVEAADDVVPAARALAWRLASLPPLAVQGTKRALNQLTQLRAGEVVETALLQEMDTLASDDLMEAIHAFEQNRPPSFTGN